MCSHSGYNVQGGGTSDDWLISRAVEIPTEGYTLTFGAQSFVMRTGERRLSDLWVFITDYQPTEGNMPTEPAMHLEQVSEGKYPDLLEKDFTSYELNLDAYAGKTIYISFANLNTDRDLLAIDNVLVQRLDNAELSAASRRYVEAGEFGVDAVFRNVSDQPLTNWVLEFDAGDGSQPVTEGGEKLEPGVEMTHTFTTGIKADHTCNWTVTLKADGIKPIVSEGVTTGLSFMPWHNVLVEEATGMWCGNCPIGIYVLENMMEHPEMKEFTIPVSVHITQTGNASDDYLTNQDYSYMLGLKAAPSVRLDRGTRVLQFSLADDGLPIDFDNPRQIATLVKNTHDTPSLIGIDVKGSFYIEGTDTVAVKATVTLRPAMTLDGSRYRVGFILTENNVGLDSNRFWSQENYLSGAELVSDFGGFTTLPERIRNWRWMDVARGVYDFHGTDAITLPQTMKMDEELEFTVEIPIPDTYLEVENGGKKSVMAPAVVASNLTLVAFVLDSSNNFHAENSAAYPMTEQADKRLTIAELAARNGIEDVVATPEDSTPEYFTLQGIKVNKPAPGLYVVRRGGKVTKEIIK